MIRKFYQSYNALTFSMPMTALAFLIFIEAFLYTRKRTGSLRMAMIITAAVLAVVMFFYYRNKIRIVRTLNKVDHLEEYEKGGCVDRTWILEERMLASDGKHLGEYSTGDIHEIQLAEEKHGHYRMHVNAADGSYDISLADRESGERLAAFLLRKNPRLKINGIHAKGTGSLRELGAES